MNEKVRISYWLIFICTLIWFRELFTIFLFLFLPIQKIKLMLCHPKKKTNSSGKKHWFFASETTQCTRLLGKMHDEAKHTHARTHMHEYKIQDKCNWSKRYARYERSTILSLHLTITVSLDGHNPNKTMSSIAIFA